MGANRPNSLPAVVRERLVGVGYAMRFFTLLHGAAAVLGRFQQFRCQFARHRILVALARGFDQPAHRQCGAARRAHFDRHLVRCTADATRLHFNRGRDVAERLLDDFDRRGMFLRDLIDRAVHDAFGHGFLTALHHHVDEAGNHLAAVLGIRQQVAGWSIAFSRHDLCLERYLVWSYDLGRFAPYLERLWRRLVTPAASSEPRTVW